MPEDDTNGLTGELDASVFRLTNSPWQTYIDGVIDTCYQRLGLHCGHQALRADLRCLRIEKCGADLPDGATIKHLPETLRLLIVSLPSQHKGGRITFSNGNSFETFDSDKCGPFGNSFVAWYPDTFRSSKKLTAGYRLTLVYNLAQTGSGNLQRAPDPRDQDRLRRALARWIQEKKMTGRTPPFLVHRLKNRYSRNDLRSTILTGSDYTQVCNLDAACHAASFDLFLATLTNPILPRQFGRAMSQRK